MRGLRMTDRYVLRTFVASYIPLAGTMILLFVIADAFTRLDKFLKGPGPVLATIANYYAAMLPMLFIRFGSFITLAAGMFAIARLQRNNEVVPIKAGGISIHRFVLPLFGCSAILAGVAFLDSEILIPRMADQIRVATRYQKRKDIVPGILRDAAGNTLYAARYRPETKTLLWATFRTFDPDGSEALVYFADRALWNAEKRHWLLEDGIVRDLRTLTHTALPLEAKAGPPPRFEQVRLGSGEEGRVIETGIMPIDVESLWESVSLLSFGDLRAQYLRQRYLPRLRVQLHDRITGPLAHVVLMLIGLPFVLREGGGRASVFVGLLALILICAGYFVITFISHAMGAQGVVSPLVAAWAPIVVFGLAGIWQLGRVRT